MSLIDFFCKNVKIIDVDGKQWFGFVETFTPAIDSEDNIDEIAITANNHLIGFRKDEIKTIEVVK